MYKKLTSSFFVDLDKSLLDNLPEITRKYNDAAPLLEQAGWMTYDRPMREVGANHGTISFSTHTHKIFPKFTDDVIDKFRELINPAYNWDRNRIRLIRTKGYILSHIDEDRNTCINIGLYNSAGAITHFGLNNSFTDFDEPIKTESYQCQDGEAYLLDVTKVHAVYPADSDNNNFRYLITYGFAGSYEHVKNVLMG